MSFLNLPTRVSSLPPQQRRARRGSAPSRTSSSSGTWSGSPAAARAGSPRRTPPFDAPRAATASACGRKANLVKCGSSNKVTAWIHARWWHNFKHLHQSLDENNRILALLNCMIWWWIAFEFYFVQLIPFSGKATGCFCEPYISANTSHNKSLLLMSCECILWGFYEYKNFLVK